MEDKKENRNRGGRREQEAKMRGHTFCIKATVELSYRKPTQGNTLTDHIEKFEKFETWLSVAKHFFFCRLASLAVQNAHFVFGFVGFVLL